MFLLLLLLLLMMFQLLLMLLLMIFLLLLSLLLMMFMLFKLELEIGLMWKLRLWFEPFPNNLLIYQFIENT